jgi:hypothetical protein
MSTMALFAPTQWMPLPARVAAVLWLSFLIATAVSGIFFSAVDPEDLPSCVSFPEVTRLGAYTIGFFLFWSLAAVSGLLAVAFTYPPAPTSGHEYFNPDEQASDDTT